MENVISHQTALPASFVDFWNTSTESVAAHLPSKAFHQEVKAFFRRRKANLKVRDETNQRLAHKQRRSKVDGREGESADDNEGNLVFSWRDGFRLVLLMSFCLVTESGDEEIGEAEKEMQKERNLLADYLRMQRSLEYEQQQQPRRWNDSLNIYDFLPLRSRLEVSENFGNRAFRHRAAKAMRARCGESLAFTFVRDFFGLFFADEVLVRMHWPLKE